MSKGVSAVAIYSDVQFFLQKVALFKIKFLLKLRIKKLFYFFLAAIVQPYPTDAPFPQS